MTINVTLPTQKAGLLSVFTIEFKAKDFDAVVESVASVKTFDELNNNLLWTIK